MTPRVPSNAIGYDSATAERLRDPSQRHIEVASEDPRAIVTQPARHKIPPSFPYLWPLGFHGAKMPMRCTHNELFPNMANVLFERNAARQQPRSRHLGFPFLCVRVVIVEKEVEQRHRRGVVLATGNQHPLLFSASLHPPLVRASLL
jgi:hypothetical protein